MEKIGVFPGSFSPFSLGHKAIVESALKLFDRVIIAVGKNPKKEDYFTIEQRLSWINMVYKNNQRVDVLDYEGLTIKFCEEFNAKFIIRGLRDSKDFIYENKIAQINKQLNNYIDTIFIMTPPRVSHISSSLLRELHMHGRDISEFVPKEIKLK
tara:strand:- start:22469 stop:22930 length:462 start_codon:yes stop_codon:yes gene_type:complete